MMFIKENNFGGDKLEYKESSKVFPKINKKLCKY
jgi:hypothetical protein